MTDKSTDKPTDDKPATEAAARENVVENAEVTGGSAMPQAELNRLSDEIIAGIKTVYDPEIPADIYELGLIYKIDIGDDRVVKIDMSLTSPNCPSAQELPIMVENAVSSVPGVKEAKVTVVWEPAWDPSRMSDEARLVLNMW
jgi:FeS assembly SUF system protein